MMLARVAAVMVLAASCGGSSTHGGSGGMGGVATDAGTGRGGSSGGGSGGGGSGVAGAHGGAGGGAGARGGATGSGGRGGTQGSGGTGSGGRITCPASSVPTCAFTACGGDLTGAWTIDGECYAPSHPILVDALGCDEVEGTGVTITASGTWTFGSDATFTRSITSQTTLAFDEPYTCDVSATDCSNVQVLDYAATCTGTGCCSCTQVRPASTTTDTGTYSVSGSTVNVTSAGGNALPWQYCVSGNTLTLFYNSGGPETITAHR